MGDQYDFYSPFFRASIIADPANPEGSRYPLWVLSDKNADPIKTLDSSRLNGLKSLAFCTEITVKYGQAYVPIISCTLNPPFEEARKFLESPLIEWTRSLLTVQFGYTNGPQVVLSPEYQGLIQKPEISLGIDTAITFNAQGSTGGFNATRAEVGKTYENKSRLEVMQDVLKPHGLKVDDTKIKGAERTLLDEKLEGYFSANLTAYYIALQLAKDCRCWATILGDTFTLKSVNDINGEKPKFKFRLFDFPGGQIGPKNGVFPILGFSTPTTSVFLSGITRGLRLHSYDSKTREIKTDVVISDDQNSDVKRSAKGQVPKIDDASPGDFFPGNTADPQVKSQADTLYQEGQTNTGVQIEVDTLGIPDLTPGNNIEVAGVAANRLDGNYAVFEVTHSIGTGGYTTKFTAISNVGQFVKQVSGDAAKVFETAKAENSQKLDEKAPDATSNSTVTIEPKAQALV